MPKEFWAEAVACAVYLSNLLPSRSVWGKTPQEAWSGRKPNISHLRVFGSIAYVHVPNEKRNKLDDKSEKSYSSAMTQIQKATNFTILILRRQLLVEMSYLMKKENGIGRNATKSTSFLASKIRVWSNQG